MKVPVGCPVTQKYGVRNPRYAAGFHTGIDFGCKWGTPIRSTIGGKIVKRGTDVAYGKYVVIEGDKGRRHYFCHMSSFGWRIRVGRMVKPGRVVGRVGSTGNSTAAHLHYEVRVPPYLYGDDSVDPDPFVRRIK